MEPPKPGEVVMKLKENKLLYTLTFGIEREALVINVLEDESVPSINYCSKLTLSDLVKESRYFKLFESLEELMPEIKNLCNENKISLKKGKASVKLILSLPIKVTKEVCLTIPQAEVDKKKVIEDLCTAVNELKREIKLLKSCQISEEKLNNNLKSEEILLNKEEKEMVFNWILKTMKSEAKEVKMSLLYKLKRDGDAGNTFHSYCNSQGYTLTLIRNTKGYRCGGFTTKSWYTCNSYNTDPNAFLFSLEFKEYYPSYDGTNAIYDYQGYGPTFGSGHDLYIANGCSSNNSSYCNFPYSYCGARARSLTGGAYYFKVDEIEVYKIEIV